MALYVIVHHRDAPEQPWTNDWQDEQVLRAITTRTSLGQRCRQAKSRGERVFVYRCGYASSGPVVSCSLAVKRVAPLDRSSCLVEFTDGQSMFADPPFRAKQGEIQHEAPPPMGIDLGCGVNGVEP